MRKRLLGWAATGLALAAAGGCGSSGSSSTDIASQPPQKILQSARAAANSLKSVHADGSIQSNGQRINLDLQLVNRVGGRGQVAVNGLAFQLIRVGRYVYLKAPAEVWQRTGASASTVQQLEGKWLRTPASGQFAPFAQLTDIRSLFAALLAQRGQPRRGPTSTVAGQKVVALKGQHGTLYVAATGQPYPIAVSRTGTNGGRIGFDRFNEAVTLSAPSGAIDLPQGGG